MTEILAYSPLNKTEFLGIRNAVMLVGCTVFFHFTVNAKFLKKLYIFAMIASYGHFISGISIYLQTLLSPHSRNTSYGVGATICTVIEFAVTVPIVVKFLRDYVKPVIALEDRPTWKYMWVIPVTFTAITMVYVGAFTYEVVSSWQYVVILILLTVGASLVYFIDIKMLWEQHQSERLTKLMDELSAQNTELNRMYNLKSEFLGGMSHELKTPLTVVSNYAQLAYKHAAKDETHDEYTMTKMSFIISEADRMAMMVNQFLEISRMEEDKIEWDFSEVDIRTLFETIVEVYFPALNKNHNTLNLLLPAKLPLVTADAGRIRQVLVNFISNAIHFTRNGIITLSACYIEEKGLVNISVEDTGSGMTAEEKSRIFDKYYTNTRENNGRISGTGLGLYISSYIVKAHGSKIKIESEKDIGTTVSFSLATTDVERDILQDEKNITD